MQNDSSTIRKSAITVYVLSLQGNRYYVGQSCNVVSRIAEHFTGKGAAWTKLHPPLTVLCAKTLKTRDWKVAERFENRLTLFLMVHHGWKNVRGGFWSNTCETSTISNIKHHNKDFVLLEVV
jgi:predicted GIY-YIG superfamily endonuclease